MIGVVADTYTHDLISAEAMLYLPLTGAFGVPVVLVHDPAPRWIASRHCETIEPRAQVRAEPLSANFERQMQPCARCDAGRIPGGARVGHRFDRNVGRLRTPWAAAA